MVTLLQSVCIQAMYTSITPPPPPPSIRYECQLLSTRNSDKSCGIPRYNMLPYDYVFIARLSRPVVDQRWIHTLDPLHTSVDRERVTACVVM